MQRGEKHSSLTFSSRPFNHSQQTHRCTLGCFYIVLIEVDFYCAFIKVLHGALRLLICRASTHTEFTYSHTHAHTHTHTHTHLHTHAHTHTHTYTHTRTHGVKGVKEADLHRDCETTIYTDFRWLESMITRLPFN